jgi:hypothetical protein
MPHLALTLELPPTAAGFTATGAEWPCHASVLQSFRTEAEIADVVARVRPRAILSAPITVVGDHVEGFGPDRDVPVTVLRQAEPVVALHEALLGDLLALPGFAPDVPGWAGAGFRPHVTAASWGALGEGEAVTFDRLAVLDLGATPGRPVVAAVVPLGSPTDLPE